MVKLKFLKPFVCYMAVALVLMFSVCFPASAASPDISLTLVSTLESPHYMALGENIIDFLGDGSYDGELYYYNGSNYNSVNSVSPFPPGTYSVSGASPNGVFPSTPLEILVAEVSLTTSNVLSVQTYSFNELFTIPQTSSAESVYVITVQSSKPASLVYHPANEGIYFTLFDMISDVVYGEDAELDGWQTMFVTIVASCAVLFAFAIPFLIVWLILRFIVGLWR